MRVPKRLTQSAGLLFAVLLMALPAPGQSAGGPDVAEARPAYGEQVFDALVLRPLGFAGALVGTVLFVPAAILTSPGGKDTVEEAFELFVLEPGRYVFRRPLGSF